MTFDVTESDLSSTLDPPDRTGNTYYSIPLLLSFISSCPVIVSAIFRYPPPLPPPPPSHSSSGHPTVPDKVQELAESLQQISGQLNSVLSALGSLAPRQDTATYAAFPPPHHHSSPAAPSASAAHQMHTLSSSAPPAPVRLSEPAWNWAPHGGSPLFSTPLSSGFRVPEDLISSRWSQMFPSRSTDASLSHLSKRFQWIGRDRFVLSSRSSHGAVSLQHHEADDALLVFRSRSVGAEVGGGGRPEAAGADRRQQEVARDAQERQQHVSFLLTSIVSSAKKDAHSPLPGFEARLVGAVIHRRADMVYPSVFSFYGL